MTAPTTTAPTPVVRTPGPTYGVDIGGTSTSVVRLAADGSLDARAVTPTLHGHDLLQGTVDAIRAVALDAPVGRIGIGVPGQVDPATGEIRHAVNLGIDGVGVPLGRAVREEFGVPVHLENDGRAAALGAHRQLAPDADVLVLVTIGTGVSAGVVIDGQVHRGRRGMAGEIGHVVIDPEGPACACGSRGCLEALLSGTALRRRWPQGSPHAAASELFDAAASGDPEAVAVADDVTGHLVRALHWLIAAYGADVAVLAGGVGSLGEPLISAVRQRMTQLGNGSPFTAELLAPERVLGVPSDVPIGAIGAAALAEIGSEAVAVIRRPTA